MRIRFFAVALSLALCGLIQTHANPPSCTTGITNCVALMTCQANVNITWVGCTSGSGWMTAECRQVHQYQDMPTTGLKNGLPAPSRPITCTPGPNVATNSCGDAWVDSDDNGSCDRYMGGCGNDGAITDCTPV